MKIFKNYKTFINIPYNVKIEKKNKDFIIKGLLGVNIINLHKYDSMGKVCLNFNEKNIILCSNNKNSFKSISKIIQNTIYGVSNGFLLYIQIVGVGYKVEIHTIQHKHYIPNQNKIYTKLHLKNKKMYQVLHFKIGFSHLFKYIIPLSVKIFLFKPYLFCIYGIDKNKISQIYAKIKQIKPATIYKGKGFRLLNEKVYIKSVKR